MTAVFRSCLPRFYSNTSQSKSNEQLSVRTNSIISMNDENFIDSASLIRSQTLPSTTSTSIKEKQSNYLSSSKQTNTKRTIKKRGPCYSRIDETCQPLLTRLVGTIFGDQGLDSNDNHQKQILSNRKQRSKRINRSAKKSMLPSQSTLKNQFDENEQTLQSLVTLLTQIESNVRTPRPNDKNQSNDLPIEKEQDRNNNRMDDTSSSHSKNNYLHISNAKSTSINNRTIKKRSNNRRKHSEEDTHSFSSITSHYPSRTSLCHRRKMIDNQQQTQISSTKINSGTSMPSCFDVMREDQTTIDAWARIRCRLKPNEQKDILRALMIICANLFEIPIENKHL